jgi:hypothetical protein
MSVDPQLPILIDRFLLVRKLRIQHVQQVVLGLCMAAVGIAYNVVTPSAPPQIPTWSAVVVALLFLLGGSAWILRQAQRARLRLLEPVASSRERAVRLAEAWGIAGNAWLTWTIVGTLMIALVTLGRIDFRSGLAAWPLWCGLLPALGLVVHALTAIPSRERLLAALPGARPASGAKL